MSRPPARILWILLVVSIMTAELGLILSHDQLGWWRTAMWSIWPLFTLSGYRLWVRAYRINESYRNTCREWQESCEKYRNACDSLLSTVHYLTEPEER